MTYKIKTGKHRSWPPRFGLFFNKKKMTRRVVFDLSCKYEIEGEDMEDTNKLFGIGYFPSQHNESVRFGWRYDKQKAKIIISSYCYRKSDRMIIEMCMIDFNRPYILSIEKLPFTYELRIWDGETKALLKADQVHHENRRKWGFPLGLYFGGNKTAPHSMTVKITKQ